MMRRLMVFGAFWLVSCGSIGSGDDGGVDAGVDAGPEFAWRGHSEFTALKGPAQGRWCLIADGGVRNVSVYEVDLDAGQVAYGACVSSGNVEGVHALTTAEASALVDTLNALTTSSRTSPAVADKSPLQLRAGTRIYGDAESLEPHGVGAVFVNGLDAVFEKLEGFAE